VTSESSDFFSSESESSESTFDPSISLPEDIYCEIISQLDEACMETNIAELWNFEDTQINSLTLQDVINKVNSETTRLLLAFLIMYTSTSLKKPIYSIILLS